jgi:hypothetical protein
MVVCDCILGVNQSWLIYLDVCQSSKLTQAHIKPVEKAEMMQIIIETMQCISALRANQ